MSTPIKLNCIKDKLVEDGRTQRWLAARLDLNYNTVNGWCNNRHQPTLTDLIKVAEFLEVAPAELITDGTIKRKRPD